MSFYGGQFVYRVNADGIGPSLLMEVFNERGWREFKEEKDLSEHWNLWWRTTGFPVSQENALRNWQFTNHIPRGATICRKDQLARNLKCLKTIYGDIYDITPRGYHLPLEYTKLVGECIKKDEKKFWICKPVGASQGRGIFIFKNLTHLCYDTNAIVQKYIHNPLLVAGYKFDLRLYVCVPSFHPLTIYLYREGLVRFATDKFSLDDLHNPFCHLTNSTLNRQGPGYKEMKDEIGSGCKWSIKQLRHYLHQSGIRDWLLWQRISVMITLTVLSQISSVQKTINCFEFYGFDILIDQNLKPWLLEVNLSPALGNDCDVDQTIKKPLLHDLFDLMGLPTCNKNHLYTFVSDRKLINNEEVKEDKHRKCHRTRGKLKTDVIEFTRCEKDKMIEKNLKKFQSTEEIGNELKKIKKSQSERYVEKEQSHPPIAMDKTKERNKGMGYKLRNKLRSNYMTWGNGRDWRYAINSKGDWSKIYPINDKLDSVDGDDQVKSVVSNLIKFEKASNRIYKNNMNMTDDDLNHLLYHKLSLDTPVWLPLF